jgi:hypothetical protein
MRQRDEQMMVNTNKYHKLLVRPVVVVSTISKNGISNVVLRSKIALCDTNQQMKYL